MIEGNGDGDEVWLWVDGDEEWVRQNSDPDGWYGWPELEKEDLVAAQSALQRRIEWAQLSPRPVPKKTADLTLEDHTRLREATPAQRCAALYWLIFTSRRKEELDLQHGWSSRSNLALAELINLWFWVFGRFASFPEQPEAWNDFLEKRKAMRCHCFHNWTEEICDWARMMKWLRPEWNLPTDIGCLSSYTSCNACKSRAPDIYDRLYGDDHSKDIPLLPIQLAFSLVVFDNLEESMGFEETPIPFLKAVASQSLSPNAQRETDQRYWPLWSPGERNTRYSPWVNAYPELMRYALVYHPGAVGPYSRLHSLPPAEALQDQYFDELPAGFADDAPNLITLVGAVIWILACRFLNGPEDWHSVWAQFIQFKKTLPLPELAGTQLELQNHLKRLWTEDSSCFRCVEDFYDYDQDVLDDIWTIYAAIIMYIKSLNLGPKFGGCPKCHAAYLTVVTGSGSGAETSLAQGGDDHQLPDLTASSTPRDLFSSPFHCRSLAPPQADGINGLYPPPSLFDMSLPLHDRQLRLNTYLQELIARTAAAGLHVPSDILHVAACSDTQATSTIPISSSSNIVELDATEGKQTPANSTRPGDVTILSFNATPTSDLKKRHKIARIKEILIDMLRKIDFPLHNRYLPWSTLEGDLQKHGYEITNWPSGVPRENDKGIHTLSAGHVHKLYAAFTQVQDEDRPRFVRRVDQLTGMSSTVWCGMSLMRFIGFAISHRSARGRVTGSGCNEFEEKARERPPRWEEEEDEV
ncbi:hypothetical protein BDN67DRAFT_512284 [Paxillus ammoniavirescens]|nr:hypothetical protein BDN67DRAFT_512284 [Paxillus ammoniavirescens]